MKRMLLVALISVAFLPNIHAQGARRRPIGDHGSPDSGTFAIDRWAAPYVRHEPIAEPAPAINSQPRGNPLVSVTQLNIPSKAIKEFEHSQKALRSGDLRASQVHLEKALHIYPDFIDAHNALGLRFTQLGEYEKALAQHQAALAVDPRVAQTHQDLALSLLMLNRAPEGEAEAREAMDLDPQAVVPRYLLARALIAQRRVTPETIDMLRQTENTIPNASLVLAQIYFAKGQTDQIVSELRKYLRAPTDSDNKQKAECWAAQLSNQPLPAGCPADATRPTFH
jgi:tetratricopeptide (TPR) repeat protein